MCYGTVLCFGSIVSFYSHCEHHHNFADEETESRTNYATYSTLQS